MLLCINEKYRAEGGACFKVIGYVSRMYLRNVPAVTHGGNETLIRAEHDANVTDSE